MDTTVGRPPRPYSGQNMREWEMQNAPSGRDRREVTGKQGEGRKGEGRRERARSDAAPQLGCLPRIPGRPSDTATKVFRPAVDLYRRVSAYEAAAVACVAAQDHRLAGPLVDLANRPAQAGHADSLGGHCHVIGEIAYDEVMRKPKWRYHGHCLPASVISHAVRGYFRFLLSWRDIEALQFERGVTVS